MLYPHSCSSLPTQSAHQRHQLSDFNQQILKGMTAGILAAAISKSAVAPMDRVKLVLQVLFNCFFAYFKCWEVEIEVFILGYSRK